MHPRPPIGILLAAGAGRRMGTPKALMVDTGGPWLIRGARVLTDAGCPSVLIVLGASAVEAQALLDTAPNPGAGWRTVVADTWASGMAASLDAGLAAAESSDAASALVSLVDLPGLPLAAVARIAADAGPDSLRQATYRGTPGHPVLIGRDHWTALRNTLAGDRGARVYLSANGAATVDCSDLWDGADRDRA